MEEPRITVIIPCFNDGELALEAVASIDEHEPVEVVVVDDGSSDEKTATAMAWLGGTGSATVIRQPNQGLSAARMAGLEWAMTRFVFTLDSDDMLRPGALGRLADALDASPEAGFAFGDYESFGDHQGRWIAPPFSPWNAMYANFWGPSAMFRTDLLKRVGGWSLPGGYEDWDLWMTMAERRVDGVRLPDVVWRRRLHGPRMQGACRATHGARYRLLRSRHPDLFDRRTAQARRESIPLWKRCAYPLVLGGRPLMPARIESLLLRIWWRICDLRRSPR